MKARITADLGDIRLIKLLKAEANENSTSIREVLITALETYFAHKLENKGLSKLAESAFDEWDDPKESEYDHL